MSKVSAAVCVFLIALVASLGSGARHASAGRVRPNMPCDPTTCGGGGCAKTVRVTFQIYSSFDDPSGSINGCWDFNDPLQSRTSWFVCNNDQSRDSGNANGPNWLYDDTNFSHSNDIDRIDYCAGWGYLSGTGYVDMAYRSSASPHWKRVSPDVGVDAYFAEVYTAYNIWNGYNDWQNDTSIGRPMINVGVADTSQAYNVTLQVCRDIGPGTRMGIYSSFPITYDNGMEGAVTTALNNCTA